MKHESEPWFQFRWQSLADDRPGRWKYAHGRCWLAIFSYFFRLEWHLWSDFWHATLELGGDEEQVQGSIAIPPFAVWFAMQTPSKSWVRRCVPERTRITKLSIFEWSIHLGLWEHEHEWNRSDPWWVRGVHLDLKDTFLGKSKYTNIETALPQCVEIHLDDRVYQGTAKFERATWKRRWWFAKTRDSVWIDMDQGHGLPHAGKGESSWDCGDDAICGFGVNGTRVEDAIQHGINLVQEYRARYGTASNVA